MSKSCFRGASGGSIACPSLHAERARAHESKVAADFPVLGTYKCTKSKPKKTN